MIPLAFLEARAGDMPLDGINSQHLMQLGSTYYLFSASRISQPPYFDGPWVELRNESIGGLHIIIEAPKDSVSAIQKFLKVGGQECASAEQMMKNSISLSQHLLSEWSPGHLPPEIVIRLLPANQGATQVEKTTGKVIGELKLYLLQSISLGENCPNLQYWASDVGQKIIHELSHIYAYQRFGFWFDDLDNEYMASATEFCFQFAYIGKMPQYAILTSGFNIDRKKILSDPVLRNTLENRRISNSIAGKIIADALKGNALVAQGGDGKGVLTEKDIPASNEICRRLHSHKPDLNDPEFIRYVYGVN